jgi:hypothetical protein
MNRFKRLRARGKALWQKPATPVVFFRVVAGLMIGAGAHSVELGIVLAIALGASGYWESREK